MIQQQNAFRRLRRTPGARKSKLQILFIKAINLLDACIVPIFVFNGAACPTVKHSYAADPPQLRRSFQELVVALGCYWHEVWAIIAHSQCYLLTSEFPGTR